MKPCSLLGLVELMRRFEASGIAPVFASLSQLAQVASTDRANSEAQPDMKRRAGEILAAALTACDDLELTESTGMVRRLTEQFAQEPLRTAELQHNFHALMRLMESEMDKRLFLVVQPDAAAFYEKAELFGPDVRKAFPLAQSDLREAGSCYATAAYTACVYHCMRALETPLGRMAAEMGVPFDVDGWQVVINNIENKIREEGRALPRGPSKAERLQFLAEAAKEFVYFKDGWRNYAAHAKASYDREQALSALNHVGAFMRVLARDLSET